MEKKGSIELGMGSFGIVTRDEIYVATKRFKNERDFYTEVKYLLQVQHENIIRIYSHTSDNRMIMEYADCGSLSNYIHKEGNEISKEKRQNLMYQCANGVSYLHNLEPPLIHRDLKPANILLTENYSKIKICDFGLAREREDTMTKGVGTLIYLAPEVKNSWKYTEKCDIYSYGIILWEVMSGEKPKNYDDNPRPPLDEVKHSTNVDFMRSLISYCWNEDPNLRPPMQMLRYCLDLDIGNLTELCTGWVDIRPLRKYR